MSDKPQKLQAQNPGDEMTAKEQNRMKNKRRIIIGICVLSVLGIISSVVLQNPEWLSAESVLNGVESEADNSEEPKFYFYPTDFNLDVSLDKEYAELDRDIYYKNGGETFSLADEDPNNQTAILRFFCQYFESVMAGDAETYNGYFTDEYLQENGYQEQFAPQMLYDILIEKLSEYQTENGDILYSFDVSYKIHKNDGSFRDDIGSDASRRLAFHLIESMGNVKIERIGQYVYG
ncbi:MAG: hypothetical protein E7658_03005 [Ruminococcaceae bacterium]|nr:hypothetical protein [Oscillospiraceae bacterium]